VIRRFLEQEAGCKSKAGELKKNFFSVSTYGAFEIFIPFSWGEIKMDFTTLKMPWNLRVVPAFTHWHPRRPGRAQFPLSDAVSLTPEVLTTLPFS